MNSNMRLIKNFVIATVLLLRVCPAAEIEHAETLSNALEKLFRYYSQLPPMEIQYLNSYKALSKGVKDQGSFQKGDPSYRELLEIDTTVTFKIDGIRFLYESKRTKQPSDGLRDVGIAAYDGKTFEIIPFDYTLVKTTDIAKVAKDVSYLCRSNPLFGPIASLFPRENPGLDSRKLVNPEFWVDLAARAELARDVTVSNDETYILKVTSGPMTHELALSKSLGFLPLKVTGRNSINGMTWTRTFINYKPYDIQGQTVVLPSEIQHVTFDQTGQRSYPEYKTTINSVKPLKADSSTFNAASINFTEIKDLDSGETVQIQP